MLRVKFSIVRDSHDNFPVPYDMAWPQLAKRLIDHRPGDKDGTAIICSTFNGTRSRETVSERSLVALDVEQKKLMPYTPQVLANFVAMKRLTAAIWTTHGHRPEAPRYRVVVPLDKPIRPHQLHVDYTQSWAVDKLIPATLAANLKLRDMVDEGKYSAASIFYLPRHPPGTDTHWATIVEGEPMATDDLVAACLMFHSGDQMRRAQLAALRKSTEFPQELRQLIEAYNDGHEIEDLLRHYGYVPLGGRWKSTYQSPGSTAATAIFPDHQGWYSWSESDKDAGLGHVCDDGIFGDAFSLWLHYEHRNDFRRAIEALRAGAGSA